MSVDEHFSAEPEPFIILEIPKTFINPTDVERYIAGPRDFVSSNKYYISLQKPPATKQLKLYVCLLD